MSSPMLVRSGGGPTDRHLSGQSLKKPAAGATRQFLREAPFAVNEQVIWAYSLKSAQKKYKKENPLSKIIQP